VLDLGETTARDRLIDPEHALPARIMAHDHVAIHAHVHIQLQHVGAVRERGLERRQRIFYVFSRGTAMSEQERTLCCESIHPSSIQRDSAESLSYAIQMAGIDPNRPFIPVQIAILTVSDTRTESDDASGRLLAERAAAAGHNVVARRIVPDERAQIEQQLRAYCADPQVDVVIATGGTGITGRDVTPEAFAAVIEKDIPGFGELFRWLSYATIGTSTIQSRALAGVAEGTYLFALPGSTGACRDAWDQILVQQLDNRYRPCNFVELMPRLLER
jgi:molybdenum cofactor biosynthesis protein B